MPIQNQSSDDFIYRLVKGAIGHHYLTTHKARVIEALERLLGELKGRSVRGASDDSENSTHKA